jgi:hypothetical protein
MQQAIEAYRSITVADEFRTLERMRSDARHNEASALYHARREGAAEERSKWEGVVANKDSEIAGKDAEIAQLRALVSEK